ncbi:hypothetical protein Bbelb_047770 [Branchiostoma belcheri]|nr:hypothetical protein Bbelb_047770 [Branchiostoma belcheri]
MARRFTLASLAQFPAHHLGLVRLDRPPTHRAAVDLFPVCAGGLVVTDVVTFSELGCADKLQTERPTLTASLSSPACPWPGDHLAQPDVSQVSPQLLRVVRNPAGGGILGTGTQVSGRRR